MEITDKESLSVTGGAAAITAAAIAAIAGLIKTMYDYGKNLGSTIRRAFNKRTC